MNNQRLKALIVIILILIIVLVLYLILRGGPLSYNVTQDYPLPTDFQSVAEYSGNNFVYSNGQALMLYNYASGQSSQLSPSVGLSANGIDSISVSQNGGLVLFHDEQVAAGGTLSKQLQAQGLSPQGFYWWLYNVSSQTFQVLPQTTVLAKLSSNGVEVLSYNGGIEQLIGYNAATLQVLSTVGISGVDDFYPSGNGAILQTPNNSILFTTNGIVSQLLAKNTTMVATTTNDQQAVIVSGKDTSRQLAILNLQTHSQKIIARHITGQPVWSSSGTVMYMVSSEGPSLSTPTTLYSYNLTTKKTYVWVLSGSATTELSHNLLTLVALLSPQAAIVSNSSSSYYLIGSGLAQPQ